MRLFNDKIISKSFLVLTLVYILDYVLKGAISYNTALAPSMVVHQWQAWRIISFPLSTHSLEGYCLSAFAFLFIGPKLEALLDRAFFLTLLSLLIILQGTLITLTFWNTNIYFDGLEGISFFMLSLYVFMSRAMSKQKFRYRAMNHVPLVIIFMCLWVGGMLIHSLAVGNSILFIGASNAVFGIVTSLITFSQVHRYYKKTRRIRYSQIEYSIPSQDELRKAYVLHNESREQQYNSRGDAESPNYEYTFEADENRLNEILDKISEYGQNSLTPNELKYLQDYSNNLK